jgi:GT2 family glycosyltransferase
VCRLSIIIPLLDDNQAFEDTLVSVLQNRPSDCEVRVVHRGAYDDPYSLGDEVAFVPVDLNADVIAASNAGMRAARGEIIHLMQPGVLAEESWTTAAVDRFAAGRVAAVSPLVLLASARERIVAAGLRYSLGGRRIVNGAGVRLARAKRVLRRKIVAPTLMAAFYRREAVMRLGGLCPKAGAWHADLDLGLSLRSLGYRCELEAESVLSAVAAEQEPRFDFRFGRASERLFWRYWRQSGPALSLIAHGGHVTSSMLRRMHRVEAYLQLLGRLAAALERSDYRQHERLLQRAEAECSESNVIPLDDEEGTAQIFSLADYSRRAAA